MSQQHIHIDPPVCQWFSQLLSFGPSLWFKSGWSVSIDLYGEGSLGTVLHELLADGDVELAAVLEVEDGQLGMSGWEICDRVAKCRGSCWRWHNSQIRISPEHVLAEDIVWQGGRKSGSTLDGNLESIICTECVTD